MSSHCAFVAVLFVACSLLIEPNAVDATTLLSEAFSESSTPAGSWLGVGNTCLTAGTSQTPATSLPPCGSNAALDSVGQGALQLTSGTTSQIAMVVSETAFSTANGLQVTFSDASFNGSNPGADGMVMFLSDASQALPVAVGSAGGSLGYASTTGTPGIANGYLGIGFDEYGGFSSPTEGRNGGPGQVPETIAVRGAAAASYPYLGGVTNSAGQAVSLPFNFDQPTALQRPSNAPAMRVVLSPAGQLAVAVDRHDGNGFVTYYTQSIVNVQNQPAVPAKVYIGFTGSTGGLYNRHQILSVAVSTAPASLPASFTPAQIPNLTAWFDPSNAAGVTAAGGAVTTLNDLSGKANNVAQALPALQPKYVATGINNLGSIAFNGGAYLLGSNLSFSSYLFNESTVFAVSNKTVDNTTDSLVWAGAYNANPRWNLRLSPTGEAFDFNQNGSGERSQLVTPTGPALWSLGGSLSKKLQFISKDGYLMSSSSTSGTSATGNYPLALGAMYGPTNSSAPFTGQLGEVLVFNRYLTTTETTEVEGYLVCKWGLHNRLPANHPWHSSCPQGGNPPSLPTPVPAGAALQDPLQIASVNGQLVFNVIASQSGSGAPQLTYNGSAVPPTLRLLPGDTLIVNLTNALPTPPSGAGYLNDTNLHYHGLHVNPNAPGDDSIDMMAMPGQTLHYQLTLPTNHPSGLYWYHSHAHGEAERQNLSGMSGALIVDGISQYVPEIAQVPERILVVRDAQPAGTTLPASDRGQVNAMLWALRHGNAAKNERAMHGLAMAQMPPQGMSMHYLVRGRSTALTRNPYVRVDPKYRRLVRPDIDSHCTGAETAAHALTVNGQTQPSIGIRPGEKQFWRVVNAGADTYLDLSVDNTSMQILAADGVPLASVGNSSPTVSDYVLPPASRVEFFVRGPSAGTTSYLRTLCFDAGAAGPPMPAVTLATLNTGSSLSDNARPRRRERVSAQLKLHPRHYHTAAWLRAQAVSGPAQTIAYSDQLTINGQAYNPSAPPSFYAQSGTTAVWTILNNSAQVHTFHIHQIHFLVQSVVGGTAKDQANVGQDLDNVNVPAASGSTAGSVTLKMDFTDPTIVGTFLLHCHILSHEDAGMMAEVRVGTAPPLSVSQQSLAFASPTAAGQTVTVSGGTTPFSVSGCTGVANASVTNATVMVAPAGGGACSLTVADATGLVASVTISVAAGASPIGVSPNQLSFASPTANALNASLSGGTLPYSVTGCPGIATEGISAQTLSVKPVAAGQCTLTISDSANNTTTVAVQVNTPGTGSILDNLTFHQNTSRTGWYQSETALTVNSVASTSFQRLATLAAPAGSQAFGKIYGQPLYASSEVVANGTTHNLVIVSTATDQVYAFDDQTMSVVWSRSFINPPNVTQQNYLATGNGGCPDMSPDIGITGTPVIDRSLDEMFVVVNTAESGVYHMRLHAISLKTGADTLAPVEVSATVELTGGGIASTNAQFNFNRSGLLEANGSIYVALGTHCDFPANGSHGWVLAYSTSNLQPSGNIINTTDGAGSYYLGSPWMGGYGPASDSAGNIYFATGNGPWDGVSDFAMSVMKVPGNLDLTKATSFTPNMELGDSNQDQDLGSGGVMLFPDGLSQTYPHLLIQGGKCGAGAANGGTTGCQKYILNRDKMGGKQTNDVGALWHADTGGGQWGGPAFFQDSSGLSHVVYGDGSAQYPLTTYNVNLASISLSVQSSTTVPNGCIECRDAGAQPIVSSNGTQTGTAVAWVIGTPGAGGGNLTLFAFDALNMSHMLFTATPGTWTIAPGASYVGEALITPLVANGKVYVPTDGSVAVYGL